MFLDKKNQKNAYFSSDESANNPDISFDDSYDSKTALDEEEDYSDKVT